MENASHDIVADLQQGSSNAYNNLYKLYYPSVEKYILKNNGTVDDAKDNFQDCMIVLLKKLKDDNFNLTASLKTYIIAISKNIWLKRIRDDKWNRNAKLSDWYSNQFSQEIDASILKEKSYWEKLQSYLGKITAHCNRLLHAMFFQHKRIEDIQKEYGYSSRHNAQNQKHKCIEQVKKVKLEEEKNNAGG